MDHIYAREQRRLFVWMMVYLSSIFLIIGPVGCMFVDISGLKLALCIVEIVLWVRFALYAKRQMARIQFGLMSVPDLRDRVLDYHEWTNDDTIHLVMGIPIMLLVVGLSICLHVILM